ncbi:hypothetical protein [uncultured Dokdonia sp.]|uniref:hypothetical protein n=1 Tax=uncultured Dokdonia sp. TaxID=575653 RepID=UPI00261CED7A|nr:hypothetical protein [uncultured Dokdonia sp.]
MAFDQISLYDVTVGIDSTRVIEYEYDDYLLEKTHLSYPDLQSFKNDNHIDEDEVFMNTDSISNRFELQERDAFSLNSHPDIILEVIPNNMMRSHYKFDVEVPDAMRGCTLRLKKIKTKNFSVYLVLDCEGPNTTSLLFQNTKGQLYADAEELIWELDLPRVQKVVERKIDSGFVKKQTPYAGGLKVYEHENKKGIKDLVSNTIFLPAEYDDIQLKGAIVVQKETYYGAYDYGLNTMLEIENKIVESRDRHGQNIVFINANNQIGIVTIYGNKILGNKIINRDSLGKSYHYKIQKDEGFFYLRSLSEKGYRNQYLSKIASTDEYENIFFESKSSDFYYNFPNILFGVKKDGGYDLFSFIKYHPPTGTKVYDFKEYVQDYKLIPGYPRYLYTPDRIVVKSNNKERIFLNNKISDNRYVSIDTYFEDFYYFTLPNGRKGWVHTSGKEYFDDE